MATLYDKLRLGFNGGAGFKIGKIFSLKPTDGSGDIDITRNGNGYYRNENGLIDVQGINIPRANWTDGRGCPSWLIEHQTDNFQTYSNSFIGSPWTKDSGVSVTSGIDDSPLLGETSTRLTRSSGTIFNNRLHTSNTFNPDSVESIFVKADSVEWVRVQIGGYYGYVNLDNGQLGTFTAPYFYSEDYGNGWYRITIGTDILLNNEFSVYPAEADNDNSNATKNQSILIAGAQLEYIHYSTSYIPTTGSSQIRFRDVLESEVTTVLPSIQGVFFLQLKALGNVDDEWRFTISDGTLDNQVCIRYLNNGISAFVTVAGATQTTFSTQVIDIRQFRNIALGWAEDNFEFRVDGDIVGSIDTSGNTFAANVLNVVKTSNGDGTIPGYGEIGELSIYDDRTLDLEDLTAYSSYANMANNFSFDVQ